MQDRNQGFNFVSVASLSNQIQLIGYQDENILAR